jgi:hypothetical protein
MSWLVTPPTPTLSEVSGPLLSVLRCLLHASGLPAPAQLVLAAGAWGEPAATAEAVPAAVQRHQLAQAGSSA